MSINYFCSSEKCPHFESVRSVRGLELGRVPSKDFGTCCKHCMHWQGGQCDLFLARGK
ncbi:MAG: hypothetical protein PHI90_08070 [Clostridia bacterium]|nr:hypothetical protein [Clostridia bacterium]